MSDLIDRIDQLIDDQLTAGEPANGFDYSDPDFPRCGHCGRHWHGLPLTERVARMYGGASYDPAYRAADDHTPIVCDGSNFIGPRRPPQPTQGRIIAGHWWQPRSAVPAMEEWWARMGELLRVTIVDELPPITLTFSTWLAPTWRARTSWWDENRLAQRTAKIAFGPQNWHHEIAARINPTSPWNTIELAQLIRAHWDTISEPLPVPTPPRPGYDFTTITPPSGHGPDTPPPTHHRLNHRRPQPHHRGHHHRRRT